MKAITVLSCVFCTALCLADTLTTLDGKKYEDYEISRLRHNGISIIHSKGAATIPWDKLPVDMQKKYEDKIPELKKKEAARLERVKKYKQQQKKQKEYQQAVKKLEQYTFLFSELPKIYRVVDKNRILAEKKEWDNRFLITDIETKNLSDDTFLDANFEKMVETGYNKIIHSPNNKMSAIYVKTGKEKRKYLRLFYIGTVKEYSNNNMVGQIWKFTVNERKAIEFLLKNPDVQIPTKLKNWVKHWGL